MGIGLPSPVRSHLLVGRGVLGAATERPQSLATVTLDGFGRQRGRALQARRPARSAQRQLRKTGRLGPPKIIIDRSPASPSSPCVVVAAVRSVVAAAAVVAHSRRRFSPPAPRRAQETRHSPARGCRRRPGPSQHGRRPRHTSKGFARPHSRALQGSGRLKWKAGQR